MKKIQTILLLFLLFTGLITVNAQTSTEIEKARKSCKPVFLVVYSSNGTDADKALAIANEAKGSLKSSSLVIKMNTSDAANSTLISKYRLSGAPLPMILVLDKNSVVSGGLMLKDATAAKLVELIPTPKTSELLKALSDGKSVYVVIYKESMTSQKNILDNCAMACSKMDNKSVTIKVDMVDKKETKLLQTLKCNLNATEPVTYVINTSGQIAGTYNGITDIKTLIGSAKKAPASGGCCSGGSKAGGCK
ncbi:MAG: hypothetical protein PHF97_06360 [Bacteroidales bacterium]|nr:hypothetical protein [Bacteroidales bacterium]